MRDFFFFPLTIADNYYTIYSSKHQTIKEGPVNIQYKKGVLELCVLSALRRQDLYGYELSTMISKRMDISDGTVYPILRKLKSDGLVTTYLSEASGGPPRKYYSITETGIKRCLTESRDWLEFTETVRDLIGDVRP